MKMKSTIGSALVTLLLSGCAVYITPSRTVVLPSAPPPPTVIATPKPALAVEPIAAVASIEIPTEDEPRVTLRSTAPPPEQIVSQPKATKGKSPKPSIDDVVSQLSLASIAFNVPETVNVKDTVKIQLLINPSASEKELVGTLAVNGQKVTSRVLVSKVMIAKLAAPDFKVVELTPTRQALDATETTEWAWELEPNSVGQHDIFLSLDAVVTVGKDQAERHVKTFDKTMTVTITPQQQAADLLTKYGQLIWTSVLLPFGLWAWKWYKKKKR